MSGGVVRTPAFNPPPFIVALTTSNFRVFVTFGIQPNLHPTISQPSIPLNENKFLSIPIWSG